MKLIHTTAIFLSGALFVIALAAISSPLLDSTPVQRFASVDFLGMTEDAKRELISLPDQIFAQKTSEYSVTLNNFTQRLKADGWILLPPGVVTGAQDITPEMRLAMCQQVGLLCRSS